MGVRSTLIGCKVQTDGKITILLKKTILIHKNKNRKFAKKSKSFKKIIKTFSRKKKRKNSFKQIFKIIIFFFLYYIQGDQSWTRFLQSTWFTITGWSPELYRQTDKNHCVYYRSQVSKFFLPGLVVKKKKKTQLQNNQKNQDLVISDIGPRNSQAKGHSTSTGETLNKKNTNKMAITFSFFLFLLALLTPSAHLGPDWQNTLLLHQCNELKL